MNRPARSRRFIALFAAYVVALQALLLPLSMAIGHPLDPSLCAANQAIENSSSPASHPSGCPCAAGCGMQCCVHALSGPPNFVVAVADMRAGVAMAPLTARFTVERRMVRRPQIPRAPPIA